DNPRPMASRRPRRLGCHAGDRPWLRDLRPSAAVPPLPEAAGSLLGGDGGGGCRRWPGFYTLEVARDADRQRDPGAGVSLWRRLGDLPCRRGVEVLAWAAI